MTLMAVAGKRSLGGCGDETMVETMGKWWFNDGFMVVSWDFLMIYPSGSLTVCISLLLNMAQSDSELTH